MTTQHKSGMTMDDLNDCICKQVVGPKDAVVDVRSAMEFADGHVPGSINIPVDQLSERSDELSDFETLYLYCRAGARAGMAFEILKAAGFKKLCCVSQGGFPNWEAKSYPVKR